MFASIKLKRIASNRERQCSSDPTGREQGHGHPGVAIAELGVTPDFGFETGTPSLEVYPSKNPLPELRGCNH